MLYYPHTRTRPARNAITSNPAFTERFEDSRVWDTCMTVAGRVIAVKTTPSRPFRAALASGKVPCMGSRCPATSEKPPARSTDLHAAQNSQRHHTHGRKRFHRSCLVFSSISLLPNHLVVLLKRAHVAMPFFTAAMSCTASLLYFYSDFIYKNI